jgi:hypothetical protein
MALIQFSDDVRFDLSVYLTGDSFPITPLSLLSPIWTSCLPELLNGSLTGTNYAQRPEKCDSE